MQLLKSSALAADFDHPLEMLKACHERMRTQCDTLRRLAAHLSAHRCDDPARQAVTNVIRFFGSAGRHHHEDEESDLFPAMIAAATGLNTERIALLVQKLEVEHRELEQACKSLCSDLEKIARGEAATLDELEVNRFNTVYRAHSALEDAALIPLAAMVLSGPELAAVGRSMARRRGVTPEPGRR